MSIALLAGPPPAQGMEGFAEHRQRLGSLPPVTQLIDNFHHAISSVQSAELAR